MKRLIPLFVILLSSPAFAEKPASNPTPKKSSIGEILFGGHNVLSLNNLALEIGGNYFHLAESGWSASRGASVYRLHYRPLKFLFVYAGLQNGFTHLSLTLPGQQALSSKFEAESSGNAIGTFGGRLALYYSPHFIALAAGEYEFMKSDRTGLAGAKSPGEISYALTRGFISATLQLTFGRWSPYLAGGYTWTFLDASLLPNSDRLAPIGINRTAHTPFIYPGLSLKITKNFSLNCGGIVNPTKNPSYSAHLSFVFSP